MVLIPLNIVHSHTTFKYIYIKKCVILELLDKNLAEYTPKRT